MKEVEEYEAQEESEDGKVKGKGEEKEGGRPKEEEYSRGVGKRGGKQLYRLVVQRLEHNQWVRRGEQALF